MDISDYQRMYATVCSAAAEAIDLLSTEGGILRAKLLLEKALLDAEEIYLNNSDSDLTTDP